MKNKYIALLSVIFMLPFTGCAKSLNDEYEDFIDADYVHASVSIKTIEGSTTTEIDIAEFKSNDDAILFNFEESIFQGIFTDDLIYYDKDKENMFLLGYWAKISDDENFDFKLFEGLDFKLKGTKEENNNLVATYTLTKEDTKIDIDANISFKNGKVDLIDIPLNMGDILGENALGEDNLTLVIDVESYGKHKKITPKDTIKSYKEITQEMLNITIQSTMTSLIEGYNLIVENTIDYYVGSNVEIMLTGRIYNSENIPVKEIKTFEFYGDYDLNIPGSYTVLASCEYKGNIYSDIFTLNVKEPEMSILDTFAITNDKINNVFIMEEYLIVSGDNNLYKVDISTLEILNYIEIKGMTNNIIYKDGFLYAATNRLYQNEYLAYYQYQGEITKINFETFEIDQQLIVNHAPYDLIIDNHGNVVYTLKVGQHVDMFFVNFEEQKRGKIDTSYTPFSAYEGDKLLYDEVLDQLIVIQALVTTQPYVLKYDTETNKYKYEKTLDIGWGFYANIQDNIIFNGSQLGFYEDGEIKTTKVNNDVNIKNVKYINSYLIDKNIYKLFMKNVNDSDFCAFTFLKYDMESDKHESRTFAFTNKEDVYSQFIVVNNKIYMVNNTSGVIEIYNVF